MERGFRADESVVTVFAMSGGPTLIIDETSLDGDSLAGSIGAATTTMLNAKAYGFSNCLMVISPEHVDTFSRSDYTKAQVRRRMQEASERTYGELGVPPERLAEMGETDLDKRVSKFGSDDDIDLVVAGSEAGKCTGFFHGWLPRSIGSIPVSRKVDA